MRRRQFLGVLGIVATAWPVTARAQQPQRLPTIGFLGTSSESAWRLHVGAFEQRLRELGWVPGRTVAMEYRWAAGRGERYAEFAAEYVRLKVDVIVTSGAAGFAAKRATSVIPIVFAVAADPLGTGLVTSLSRPGGNITGLSMQASDVAGKRLELLREFVPTPRRVGILGNVGYPAAVLEIKEVQTAATALGFETLTSEIRRAEDIASAIEQLKDRIDALYVCADPLVNTNSNRITTSALAARLPTLLPFRQYVDDGGLISYGPSFTDLFRRAGDYVNKILRGANPADIPVEQPTKFELVINLKTAKALGLIVPPTLLARSDDVIE